MNVLIFNLRTDADDDVLGFTTAWINGIAERVRHVVVVTMQAGRLDVRENVVVYSVGRERGYSEARRLIEFYRIVTRVLGQEHIDICFAHMMPLFAVMGWPLLRRRRIPIVMWYAHGHVPPIVKVATALVDCVVASGQTGFRLNTPKLRVIGQGIDVIRFRPSTVSADHTAASSLVLVTVGRVSRVKNLDILIRAIADLRRGGLPVGKVLTLKIAGRPLTEADLKYLKSLTQLIDDLEVRDQVQLLDAVPFKKVDEVLRGADIFVNASDTDSMDKAVLEAMSCGMPVITSNISFRDVLPPQLIDLLCFRRGAVEELAIKIAGLARMHTVERRQLGLMLREIVVNQHSLSALCGRLLDIFEELAGASDAQQGARR